MNKFYLLLIIVLIVLLCFLYVFSKKSKNSNEPQMDIDYMNKTVELNENNLDNSSEKFTENKFKIVEDITFSEADEIINI